MMKFNENQPNLSGFSILLLIIGICTLPRMGVGQQNISTSDLLKDIFNNAAFDQYQNQKEFLEEGDFSMPFIRKLEFRTQTNENDFQQQEYRIRFSPTGRQERRAQLDYHRAYQEAYAINETEIANDLLIDRYQQLIDWLTANQEAILANEKIELLDIQLKTYRRLAAAGEDVLTALISAEDALHSTQQILMKAQQEAAAIEKELGLAANTNALSIDTSQWVSLPTQLSMIEQWTNDLTNQTSTAYDQLPELQLIEAEKRLELAKRKKWLDFIETRYERDDRNPFQDQFVIGVGIEIPFKNQARLDVNELELERLEIIEDLTRDRLDLIANLQSKLDRHRRYLEQSQLTKSQLQNSQAKYAADRLNENAAAGNPFLLVKIRLSLLQKETLLQDINRRAFDNYIEVIELLDKAAEIPYRNYLLEGFPVLEVGE